MGEHGNSIAVHKRPSLINYPLQLPHQQTHSARTQKAATHCGTTTHRSQRVTAALAIATNRNNPDIPIVPKARKLHNKHVPRQANGAHTGRLPKDKAIGGQISLIGRFPSDHGRRKSRLWHFRPAQKSQHETGSRGAEEEGLEEESRGGRRKARK